MNSFFFDTADTAGISITHPDRVQRPRTVIGPAFSVGRLSAEFSDFSLSWLPTYPSMLSVKRPVHPNWIGVDVATFRALWPTSFLPTYPTYWPAPRLHRVFYRSVFDPASGNSMVVAQRMAWDPKQKAPLVKRPRPARTQWAYVQPAAVITSGTECVEMVDEQGATPTLLSAGYGTPGLIDHGFSVPALIQEDFC